jgi:sensor histidine kinase YesM
MLEASNDYLHASLGPMRATDVPLAVELETARCYLQLIQIRMGRRLTFSIEPSETASRSMLPPLLLQPLVENAVHHGPESKIDGGGARLVACVRDGLLHVTVDGIGLDAAHRAARAGHGTAIANIRERLQTRYAHAATLHLEPLAPGTRTTLVLPVHRP